LFHNRLLQQGFSPVRYFADSVPLSEGFRFPR
jgi:hypothetical protein